MKVTSRAAIMKMKIDNEKCIDCGACEPECPVEAIFPEEDTPEKWQRKYYSISEAFLEVLAKKDIPSDVVENLKGVQDREYNSENDFITALEETIGAENVVKYKHLIIFQAWQDFIEKNYERFEMSVSE
ncbi:MAG: ferredoxin family protein [Candidatus Heimdallarchaeota archaeon]|nr:ferredoxin family protein [Candidatus Heimdallarchaeota archaeon]